MSPDVRPTIYLIMPVGSTHGWGVCGRYITRELAALAEVRLLANAFEFHGVDNEIEDRFFRGVMANAPPRNGEFPVLHSITGKELLPCRPDVRGRINIGYTFFEDNLLAPEWIENARRHFDIVVTGSSWCTNELRAQGLENPRTIIQGIDPVLFRPEYREKEFLRDEFAIFSGGKCEFRKGQDLVIRAYKVLQDRHRDVLLVHSWHNLWQFSFDTMRASPYIRFSPTSSDPTIAINQVLADNGIDLSRTIAVPPCPNAVMPQYYRNTDVGLFPNRCEGGTNLVLMEYMACGKPVVASYASGHQDIVNDGNALLIRKMRQLTINNGATPVAIWDDPDLEETIERLEWAYQNRDALRRFGARAGEDLKHFTWARTARQFFDLLAPMA